MRKWSAWSEHMFSVTDKTVTAHSLHDYGISMKNLYMFTWLSGKLTQQNI